MVWEFAGSSRAERRHTAGRVTAKVKMEGKMQKSIWENSCMVRGMGRGVPVVDAAGECSWVVSQLDCSVRRESRFSTASPLRIVVL